MQTRVLSNGQEIWIATFTGEVLSSDKTRSVSVHQSDARVISKDLVIPGQIYSETNVHHEVWLRNAVGKEKQVNLGRIQLAVRPGQVVTVAWGQSDASQTGFYFAARNHSTGEMRHDIAAALGNRLKEWKLRVGAGLHVWMWTILGALGGAIFGGMTSHTSRFSDPVQQFLTACAPGAVVGLICGFLFGNTIGLQLSLSGKVTGLLGEVNSFAAERLLAAGERMAADGGLN